MGAAERARDGNAGAEEAAAGLDGERIEIVHYQFGVADGTGDGWQVRRFALAEGLSRPFELRLEVLTPDLATDTEALLGASCSLLVERGTLSRGIAGVIEAVEYVGVTHGHLLVRLEIVPAFALLRHQIDSRIFHRPTHGAHRAFAIRIRRSYVKSIGRGCVPQHLSINVRAAFQRKAGGLTWRA